MYSIKADANFSAAHNLRGYKGRCEELHGHNWKVEVECAGKALDKAGMLLDFRLMKEKLENILDSLDHKYLNRTGYFRKVNPTSENIAKFIYDSLKKKLPCLESVRVWESDNCSAVYRE